MVVLCLCSFGPAEESGAITGTVTDDQGNPISGIVVEVECFESEDEAGSAVTDANGSYAISDLPAGQYLVEACPGCTGEFYINQLYNDKINFSEADPVTG